MTIAALAISMALLLSMLSIAEGMLVNAKRDMDIGEGDLVVAPFPGGELYNGHELAIELLDDTDNISATTPFLIDLVQVHAPWEDENKGDDGAMVFIAIGISPDSAKAFLDSKDRLRLFSSVIQFEDWFTEESDPHYALGSFNGLWTNEILMDQASMEKYSKTKGGSLEVFPFFEGSQANVSASSNRMESLEVTISGGFSTDYTGEGLASQIIGGILIFPLSELQSLTGKGTDPSDPLKTTDRISGITVSLKEDIRSSQSINSVSEDLQDRYPYYRIITREQQLKTIEEQVTTAQLYYSAIGLVTLVIGLLFVATTMLMAIWERTREIGVMRAIGISKMTIFRQIMAESIFIVILGALIGLFGGILGSRYLGSYISDLYGLSQDMTAVTPTLMVSSFIEVLLIGILFSLYPAAKAIRMRVVDAMKFRT